VFIASIVAWTEAWRNASAALKFAACSAVTARVGTVALLEVRIHLRQVGQRARPRELGVRLHQAGQLLGAIVAAADAGIVAVRVACAALAVRAMPG